MDKPAEWYANLLLRALRAGDPRAAHLRSKARGKVVVIGLDENGTWVPILRLSNPSASFNVMSLDMRHGTGWSPAFERGTPSQLAERLLGPFLPFWAGEVDAVVGWGATSDQGH